MEFFSKLLALGITSYTLKVIAKEHDQATVIIVPKTTAKDTALQNLKPLSLTGSISELDNAFFDTICQPIQNTAELFSNVNAFEAQQQEVAKATELQKQKNKTIETSKAKITKILEDTALSNEKRNSKIKPLLEAIVAIDPDNAFAAKTKEELLKNSSTLTMNF